MEKILLILILGISCTFGQLIFPLPCPVPAPVSNFNLTQYLGKWYEIQRYNNSFEGDGQCVTAQYTLNANNTAQIDVVNELALLPNTTRIPIQGTARLKNPSVVPILGELLVRFGASPESDYIVLATDYTHYAIVSSCTNLNTTSSIRYAWVLSRDRNVHPNVAEQVQNLTRTHFDETLLMTIEQSEAKCGAAAIFVSLVLMSVTMFAHLLN